MSAKRGGDLGFFAKDRMVPEFAEVAFSAKPNTVSDVVQTQYGYHIIMVQDRKAASTTPYKKAKSKIKDFLKNQHMIIALDELTTAAKKKAEIEYMDERYNPENIQKKLSKQVDDITGRQVEEAKKQSQK